MCKHLITVNESKIVQHLRYSHRLHFGMEPLVVVENFLPQLLLPATLCQVERKLVQFSDVVQNLLQWQRNNSNSERKATVSVEIASRQELPHLGANKYPQAFWIFFTSMNTSSTTLIPVVHFECHSSTWVVVWAASCPPRYSPSRSASWWEHPSTWRASSVRSTCRWNNQPW